MDRDEFMGERGTRRLHRLCARVWHRVVQRRRIQKPTARRRKSLRGLQHGLAISPGATATKIIGLAPGTTYQVRMKALDADAFQSPWSATAQGTTASATPGAVRRVVHSHRRQPCITLGRAE
ncbi:MAG: hypothetical protein IBGAMO2_880008 [Arenicellales bacterium IbO2]|nr:MAG: hypothetical protein IBGAMO2_880008 [Arenicellales bacterium IbO2]